jgi:hypothetical protein
MPTREVFVRTLWERVINAPRTGAWIDGLMLNATRPGAAFADAGEALSRLLTAGADRHDLNSVARAAIYEAVFDVLYMLDDPGVDDGNVFMLHESLLSADPSGREGRPEI